MLHAMFTVNATNKSKLLPFFISLFTWGKVYHCELLFTNGISLTTSLEDGVHWVKRTYNPQDWMKCTYNPYDWVAIPLPWIPRKHEKTIKQWADNLIESGARYDTRRALFGGLFPKVNDTSAYFCSELLAESLAPYTPGLDGSKWYTPNDLWKLLSEFLINNYPQYRDPRNIRLKIAKSSSSENASE